MLVEQRGMRRFDRKAEKPQMPRRIASDVTLERDVAGNARWRAVDGERLPLVPAEALAGFDVRHAVRQRHAARSAGDAAHAPFGHAVRPSGLFRVDRV